MAAATALAAEEALLTEAQARACVACGGGATPLYVYDEARLRAQADAMLAFPAPFGLTVRFALKALPNAAVLRLFLARGLAFDASSGFEARRLAEDPMTLEDLAAEFGVSRERVRQIEVRAFEKVQAAVKTGMARIEALPPPQSRPALPAH